MMKKKNRFDLNTVNARQIQTRLIERLGENHPQTQWATALISNNEEGYLKLLYQRALGDDSAVDAIVDQSYLRMPEVIAMVEDWNTNKKAQAINIDERHQLAYVVITLRERMNQTKDPY